MIRQKNTNAAKPITENMEMEKITGESRKINHSLAWAD